MGSDQGLEKLLFELASESRLSILRELQEENLKMQEIARRLDITATEAFRQLERLSAASLVQRQPDGAFAIAEYGKLVLQLTSSLNFAAKHKDYFSTHDVTGLPIQFVSRLGELSQATLVMDTIEFLNKGEQAFIEAEQYGWGIAEGTVPERMGPIMDGQILKGVNFRFIIPERRFSKDFSPSKIPRNLEARSFAEIPAIVIVTEKVAGVSFRQLGGRIDYAGFFGTDPTFHNWVKDLFLYYWGKAKQP